MTQKLKISKVALYLISFIENELVCKYSL